MYATSVETAEWTCPSGNNYTNIANTEGRYARNSNAVNVHHLSRSSHSFCSWDAGVIVSSLGTAFFRYR